MVCRSVSYLSLSVKVRRMVQPTHDSAGDYVTLGRALRALRDRAALTQVELADRVEVGSTFVSQVEHGHRGVRWHTLLRFLAAVGADLHQLADAIAEVENHDRAAKQ
jgi:transcriptional regulator with XRE-family HTH domain